MARASARARARRALWEKRRERFIETGDHLVWHLPDGRVFETILVERYGREMLLRRDLKTRRWVRR